MHLQSDTRLTLSLIKPHRMRYAFPQCLDKNTTKTLEGSPSRDADGNSDNREIVFVRANHWTTSLASLVHFTSRHAISLRLILIVIMPIICLLTFLHFPVKSGTKMRQRKPASSSVMTPGR